MQDQFNQGLATLSPEEMKILDDVIDNNPQFFIIVQKAWPFIGEAFKPFVDNDADGDGDDMGGGAPVPQEQPPIMGPQSVLANQQFRV